MLQMKKLASSVLLPTMASSIAPEESARQTAADNSGITPLCGSFFLHPNNQELVETVMHIKYI